MEKLIEYILTSDFYNFIHPWAILATDRGYLKDVAGLSLSGHLLIVL